jgi:hypothetical protein
MMQLKLRSQGSAGVKDCWYLLVTCIYLTLEMRDKIFAMDLQPKKADKKKVVFAKQTLILSAFS